MIRICFYGHFLGRGTERATVELANMLCEKYRIHILNTADVELTYKLDKRVVYSIINSNGVIKTSISLGVYLKQHYIDILVAVESLSGITALPAAILTGTKSIIWDHGNYFQTKGSKYMNITRKIELLFCDAYVVLTDRDVRLYQKHFKHIRTMLLRIYNAVEIQFRDFYDVNSKTIISIGHIDSNKNFIIIPRIACSVFCKHSDWNWDIYGNGNERDVAELRKAIKQYHMENHIRLKGFINDIESVYNTASFCVMTSIHEGFPLVLIEAKSHGIPIISFDIDTGPDEIIRDGVNGYLIKPYDTDEMTNRIRQMIEEPERRQSFSENCHLDLFELKPDVILYQWIELLDNIVNT